MSEYDFKPEDDAALTMELAKLTPRLFGAALSLENEEQSGAVWRAYDLLMRYHEELMMRRHDARGMRGIIDALQPVAWRASANHISVDANGAVAYRHTES